MSHTIDAHLLQQWLQDRQEIALFDIREAGQFGEGHLFFAVPLPYSRLEIDVLRLAPRKQVRLVLVDDGDALAATAARRLEQLGYTEVHVLDGGVKGWSAAGYTLFKGVNVPSKTFGEVVEHAYATPHISATELDQWRSAGKQFTLLDGRTVEEHHKMTIPGSVSCPNGELAYRIQTLVKDADTPVVINCAGRTRSILGAQTLRNLHLPNPVLALENGTQGWYLAGLTLEHGSQQRYADVNAEASDLASQRQAAEALRQRFAIPRLTSAQAQAWIDDDSRTSFVFDIRSAEEFAANTLAGAQHAAGGQLIQATDQYLGVRNSRLILLDHEQVRAAVVASWLYQLGFEVAVLEEGINSALQLRHSSTIATADAVSPADITQLTGQLEQHQALLIDIRASAAFRQQHVAGSRWSTRARLVALLGSLAALPKTVALIADTPALATWAAQDLHEAGVLQVVWLDARDGLATLRQAGFPLNENGVLPNDAERIDYLFFVHDRHDGNRAAAEQYLAWETALIGQCRHGELDAFRVG
jgi:rhodanese-related sulfurtransferase